MRAALRVSDLRGCREVSDDHCGTRTAKAAGPDQGTHVSHGPMVARPGAHVRRAHVLPDLWILGHLRQELLRRSLHRSVRLALPGHLVPRGRAFPGPGAVRRLVRAASRVADPRPARRLPADVLLLSKVLLPLVLGVSARV